MRHRNIPEPALAQLRKLEKQAEHCARQTTQTQDAIAAARSRLTGGFQRDQQYHDLRRTLDRLLDDLATCERNEDTAKNMLCNCKAWLDELADDAVLELVKVKPNGRDLGQVRQRIEDAEDELRKLASVPVPTADIKQRVTAYVASLARPKVTGIEEDDQLNIVWPNSTASLLALLLPDKMVDALMNEMRARRTHRCRCRNASDALPN